MSEEPNGNGSMRRAEVLLLIALASLIGAMAAAVPVLAEVAMTFARRGC